MDVFDFVQYLPVIDDILVTAVVIALFLAMGGSTFPEVKRAACRVLKKPNHRDKYYRG
jgi:uncharacterized membrane protein YkvA (DUF1232 family)